MAYRWDLAAVCAVFDHGNALQEFRQTISIDYLDEESKQGNSLSACLLSNDIPRYDRLQSVADSQAVCPVRWW